MFVRQTLTGYHLLRFHQAKAGVIDLKQATILNSRAEKAETFIRYSKCLASGKD